jgi:proteic killer suppression protein
LAESGEAQADPELPRSAAELILQQRRVPKGAPTDIAKVTRRKLVQLDGAMLLSDLAVPPGNRLEALRGDLAGIERLATSKRL